MVPIKTTINLYFSGENGKTKSPVIFALLNEDNNPKSKLGATTYSINHFLEV